MANTVTLLSYANTFSDWVVVTNALVGENNTLAKRNYTKDSGTLYLNDIGLGLQVANTAIVQGQLRVTGVGSSAFVEKNLSVTGQSYFQNTILSFIASGQAEIDGQLILKGANNSLEVANNANISGSITVGANSTTNGSTTLQGTLRVNGAANINNILAVTGNVVFKDSLIVTNDTQTTTLEVSETAFTKYLNVQENIGVGGSAVVRYGTTTDKLQANSYTNTSISFVSNTTYSPIVVSNTSVNAAAISVTGTTTTNNLTSNTSTIGTSKVTNEDIYGQANINSVIANSGTITVVSGLDSYYNRVRANTYVATNILYANNITANAINASSNLVSPRITVTSILDGNSASAFFNNLQTLGQLSVGGNFVLNGTVIYNTNTFTINAGSAVGQYSNFSVNRGMSGANADIRWDEPHRQFTIRDVDNGQYYRILTDEHLSDSTSVVNSSNVATSAVANTLNNYINTANTYFTGVIAAGNTWAQANVGTALAVSKAYTDTSNTFTQNFVTDVVSNKIVPAYTRANTGLNFITGTSGTAVPSPTGGTTGITMNASNGVTIIATGNTLTFSTPQDLRRTASPIFSGLSIPSGGTPIDIISGGTGAYSRVGALTNLLPDATGVPQGYVLSTQGVGTYTWVAGGVGSGGGGTQPGSRITTSILTATGTGSKTVFTSLPTFDNGSNQLRVYIDGVRQYEGYTENGTSGVTFSVAPASGAKILFEVDAYMVYAYYANNISISVPIGGISAKPAGATTTIEEAVTSIEGRKANLTGGADFNGVVTGPTMPTGASNTAFATTAFVKNQSYTTQSASDSRYAPLGGSGTSGLWGISITGYAGSIGNGTESLTIPAGGTAPGANKLVRTQTNGYTFVNYINSDTARSEDFTPDQIIATNSGDNYYRKVSIAKVRDAIQSAGITASTATDATYATRLKPISGAASYKMVYVADGAITNAGGSWGKVAMLYDGNGQTYGMRVDRADYADSAGSSGSAGSATLAAKASTLSRNGGDGTGMTFNWSGQPGQPTWLWGSNNGTDIYVWNPSNFSVNYADSCRVATSATSATSAGSAGSATTADHLTGPAHTNGQDGWFRSNGDCGWYNESYGGGIYMSDTTWVRTYNSKNFYCDSNILAGGNVTAYSDARLKDNIQTLKGSLSKILQMRGVEFDKKGKHGIGVIAQEVQKFYPEVVLEDNPDDKMLSVNYGALVGPLIESIKELKSEIDSLKAELDELKGKK